MSNYQPFGLSGSVVGTKTATETPAEAFAGGTVLADRSRLRITNLSSDTRIRVGVASANLQRDGQPVEPGDTVTLYPTTTIYAASEGRPVTLNIEEK
jgi:hypothetical protein